MKNKKEVILFVDPEDTNERVLEALTFYEWGLGGIYPDKLFDEEDDTDDLWQDMAKKEGSTRRIKLTLMIEDI